jgi:hypothetical protein
MCQGSCAGASQVVARYIVKPLELVYPRVNGDEVVAVRPSNNVKPSMCYNCSQHQKAMRDLLDGNRAHEHVRECTPEEFPFRVSHIRNDRVL